MFTFFVTAPVKTWYWINVKINPSVNWPTLRLALIEQYRSLDTDFELSRRITERRQGAFESFDSFYEDLIVLNSKLRNPKTDREFIKILKQNV